MRARARPLATTHLAPPLSRSLKGVPLGPYSAKRDFKVYDVIVGHSLAMASICNDEQGAFGAMSGHDRKTLSLSVKVSNPERVIDPSTGLTKLDLVRYYESIAEWMIPRWERSLSTICATATRRPPRRHFLRAPGPAWGSRCPSPGTNCRHSRGSAQWGIATAREYLSFRKMDRWTDYWKSKQSLSGAVKLLKR
jgi:hypothetical protein